MVFFVVVGGVLGYWVVSMFFVGVLYELFYVLVVVGLCGMIY